MMRPYRATKRLIVGPCRSSCRGVLKCPAGYGHSRTCRVIKLDVIISIRGAAIAAAAVDLADHNVIRNYRQYAQSDIRIK